MPCRCALADLGHLHRRGPGQRPHTWTWSGCVDAAQATGGPGHPPRLRLPVRERGASPRPCEERGLCFPRAYTAADARLRPQAQAPGPWPRRAVCPCCPGPGSWMIWTQAPPGGRAHRLSGDAQEQPRGRRHRHARVRAYREPWHATFEAVQRVAAKQLRQRRGVPRAICERARHIEVQIFGDGMGEVVVLGERDRSSQRRNQKIARGDARSRARTRARDRAALLHTARALLGRTTYWSAGPWSTCRPGQRGTFAFLEVKTRLQVEHGVTEAMTCSVLTWSGWTVRLGWATAQARPTDPDGPERHAIEAWLYAEDPGYWDFRPSPGRITAGRFAPRGAADTLGGDGQRGHAVLRPVAPAKLIVHVPPTVRRPLRRIRRRDRLARALDGIETNLAVLG